MSYSAEQEVVDLLPLLLLVSRVRPVLSGASPGAGIMAASNTTRSTGHAIADGGRGERAQRLRDHDEAGSADRADHRVGVLGEPGRVVVAR
jgi:hypothetical protein